MKLSKTLRPVRKMFWLQRMSLLKDLISHKVFSMLSISICRAKSRTTCIESVGQGDVVKLELPQHL